MSCLFMKAASRGCWVMIDKLQGLGRAVFGAQGKGSTVIAVLHIRRSSQVESQ